MFHDNPYDMVLGMKAIPNFHSYYIPTKLPSAQLIIIVAISLRRLVTSKS